MEVSLQKPHIKQKEVIKACLDPLTFFIICVIGRQFGKSSMGQNMALFWALNNKNSIIYWVSPTDSQSNKVYKGIIDAIYESGCIRSKKQPKGDTEIVFKNGSKIQFRSAASEDNLRGASVDYMILDEAAFIKKDTLEAILLPMLSIKGKKLLILTTPKGKNWVYDYYKKGQIEKNWKSFRFSTYDSPLANDELIEMFRQTLPDKLFKQEVEAQFVDNSSIFNNLQELLMLKEQDEPIEGECYYAGIDIGLINDASVLCILNENGDLVKYYRWDDISSPILIQNILDINDKWNFSEVMIENNNQGLVIYQTLQDQMNNLTEFNTNSRTKPEIINRLIYLFNMKEMKLVKDELLRIELEGYIFKQNNNGNLSFMADSGFHDDIVMALAIARYCYDNRGSDEEYNFITLN